MGFNRNKTSDGPSRGAAEASAGRGGGPGRVLIANRPRPDIPGYAPARSENDGAGVAVPEPAGSKLIVGRDIHLKGEITSCDVLVVEGKVEASMNSRYIRIAETGVFEGDCEIDTADIEGRFEGALTVRETLVLRATGQVIGTVRYGQIAIEAGGTIAGRVEVLEPQPAASTDAADEPRAAAAPAPARPSDEAVEEPSTAAE